MQLAFDSMQAGGGRSGVRIRPDPLARRQGRLGDPQPGGRSSCWRNLPRFPHQHFHDRASAYDPAVIRVMSFQQDNPKEWSGQTLLTADLIGNAYAVVTEGLERTRDHL